MHFHSIFNTTNDSPTRGEQEMQERLNKQANIDKHALTNAYDTRYGQPNMG
jgi:hypothetical protein